MIRLDAASLLAAAALALAPFAAAASGDGPVVSTFTLENGLRGVVIEDHRAPVVTHMVWYQVGAADEADGESGLAHFLEHLMFKGTDDVEPGMFSKIIAANGGQDNAFTSLDYTAYHQRVAADRLDLVMKLEADRMRDLVLDEANVITERKVVLEERSARTDNDPTSRFYEQLNAALYLNHPYGQPVIGWRSEIEQLSLDGALAFYKKFYGPDNAILVVAGDVAPAEVERLAREHYGALERAGVGPRPRPVEPPQIAERRVLMRDPLVSQPFVTRVYQAAGYVGAEPGAAEALDVLAEVLGGGVASRLSRALVLEQKIAIDAGAYASLVARDGGSFGVYGVPAEGVALAAVEAAIDAELARMAAEGPTAAEVARAQRVLIADAVYQQDSQATLARIYGTALSVGLGVEDVQAWPERIRAVTPEAVRAAAASLRREASVTGHLEKADAATETEQAR